jgi:DNA-binding CsgD family transcriptional regulator
MMPAASLMSGRHDGGIQGEASVPSLTRRQREVAHLIGEGLTNREIAGRLFISERTVEGHVDQLRDRLGVQSRTQIASRWTEQRLTGGATAPSIRRSNVNGRLIAAMTVLVLLAAGSAATLLVHKGASGSMPSSARITTVVGNGTRGFAADGKALEMPLGQLAGLAIAPDGTLFFVDGNRVRTLGPAGAVMTVAGTGNAGDSGDSGPAASAELNAPQGIALDSTGDLLIADTGNHRVRRVDRSGTITTYAGTGQPGSAGDGGPAAQARLDQPVGVAVGPAGAVYVSDLTSNVVRRVNALGTITTYAGTGEPGYAGDGGPAISALLDAPGALAVDLEGNLYLADTLNDRVRKVDPSGDITTYAGTGVRGFAGDGGQAVDSHLALALGPPSGIGSALAVDVQGDLFVADTGNQRVREVTVAGMIVSIAGSGRQGDGGDNAAATLASLDNPISVAVDFDGTVFVADAANYRIRSIRT